MNSSGLDPIRNIYIMEFTGAKLEVSDHPDPTLIGVNGSIVRETMKTFHVRTGNGDKTITKNGGRFRLTIRNGEGETSVEILGDDIMFRSVDRTKKCEKRKPPRKVSEPETS